MHHEADKNSTNSCQLIPTHYEKTSNHNELSTDGLRMKDVKWILNVIVWTGQAGSKIQGVNPVER